MVIEGEIGTFYGPVNKVTGIPYGYGVLDAGVWLHCSSVLNGGKFSDGKRISVNRVTKEMKLVNTKFQSDGSKLQKIESFTALKHTSGLYKNDVRVEYIIERFNLNLEEQDWFSMRPQGGRYHFKGTYDDRFGELNADN